MRDLSSGVLAVLALWPLAVAAQDAERPLERVAFADALERAGERNPTALQARQEILRAEALVRQAAAGAMPTLDVRVTGQRLDHERAIGDRVLQEATSFYGNEVLAVPLVAPRSWTAWLHARDRATIAKASADDVRRTLQLATAQAYLAVVTQHRSIEVAERALKTAEAHLEFARGRLRGGIGHRIDEVRAAQEVESTHVQLRTARAGLIKTQEALGVLLAEDERVDVEPDVELPDLPDLDESLGEAATRRTDLRLLEERLELAHRVARNTYTEFLPTLTGQFLFVFQYPATVTSPEAGWQAQLVLTVPLFDGGYDYGVRREDLALEEEARLAHEGALRQARADIRAAFAVLRCAEEALEAARRSALLAQETLDLANQAYQAGATTNIEVVDAERRARDAETAVAAAEDAARHARLDVLAASGRFP
jgi:outer membrane protein TolC